MSSVVPPAPARTPLPEGTVPVGIALLRRRLRHVRVLQGRHQRGRWFGRVRAPLASLWFATFALAPGLFLPLEQELGRAISHRRALTQGAHPVVRKVVLLGTMMLGLALLGIAIASPFLASAYFDGNWFMVLALAMTFVGYAPAHLARGVCSGSGRFTEYAVIMGSDGVVRIILCVVLAAIGITAVGAYGMVIAISPLFAVVYVFQRGGLKTDPGPDSRLERDHPESGMAAARLDLRRDPAQRRTDRRQPARRSRPRIRSCRDFSYGVLLARIPLFLFQAVQAALLPRLSRLAARGEIVDFRSRPAQA